MNQLIQPVSHPRDQRPTGHGLTAVAGDASRIRGLIELERRGIKPDIVTGSSVGAIVAGALASGNLDTFEAWIRGLRRVDIIRLLDAEAGAVRSPG